MVFAVLDFEYCVEVCVNGLNFIRCFEKGLDAV